jgi:hypothetical protein
MKSYWISHQNKKIFYARYDNLSLEDLQQEMSAAAKEVNQHAPDSVLLLINTTGTIISPAALNLFKDTATATKKQIHKTAVLGVTGARRTMLDIVVKFSGMNVVPFEDEQQAKTWLIQP